MCIAPPPAGTLRPDLIESASPQASARAHVIKTHHNDTQLVRELRQKVNFPSPTAADPPLFPLPLLQTLPSPLSPLPSPLSLPAGPSDRAAERVPQRRGAYSGEGAGSASQPRLQTPVPRSGLRGPTPLAVAGVLMIAVPTGPGLAIRVICQREAYILEDFASTNSLLSHLMSLGRR